MGPLACDDADPCTTDMCLAQGCVHLDALGFDSVTCVCQRQPLAECPSVPALITRRQNRSCKLFDHAASASSDRKAKARLRAGLRALHAAEMATLKASRKGKITGSCAAALGTQLRDAETRARNLLTSL